MTYPGGKNADGVYQAIINQIPPHSVYIEPFLGSGAIARLKRPAELTICVDLDRQAIDKFAAWAQTNAPLWGPQKLWQSGAEDRTWWTDASSCLQLIQGDALTFLRYFPWARYPDSFVYLDPPYPLRARRSSRRMYVHEETPEFQEELLSLAVTLPTRVAISGYENELYSERLKDWRVISYTAVTRGGNAAKEFLWMNYPQPKILHDSRYTGARWQDRQLIRKMTKRWLGKLEKMEPARRLALIDAIKEFEGQNSPLENRVSKGYACPESARVFENEQSRDDRSED